VKEFWWMSRVYVSKGGVMVEDSDEVKGRAKRAVGELTDDEKLKREGSVDKASGKVKKGVDKAADKAKELLDRDK
jgi:uncharacterized protein YjbJ (UPF0337 family)